MNFLLCDNTVKDQEIVDISIYTIKNYLEKYKKYKFNDNNNKEKIYVSENKENYICLRHVHGKNNEEQIMNLTHVIDDFCRDHADGVVIMHLGLIDRDSTNYYNYPSIKAVRQSQIKEKNVIFYSTFNVPLSTFEKETHKDYRIICTTKVNSLMNEIFRYLEQ